jgi:hypothetical protein
MRFTSGSKWYYITPKGKIKEFIIHSGLSPQSAEVLASVHIVYSDWTQANEALTNYNKIFTSFKDIK